MKISDRLPGKNITILGMDDALGYSVPLAGAVVNRIGDLGVHVETLKWRLSVLKAYMEGRWLWTRPLQVY